MTIDTARDVILGIIAVISGGTDYGDPCGNCIVNGGLYCGIVCTAVCRKEKVDDIDLTFHGIFDGCDQRI